MSKFFDTMTELERERRIDLARSEARDAVENIDLSEKIEALIWALLDVLIVDGTEEARAVFFDEAHSRLYKEVEDLVSYGAAIENGPLRVNAA